MKEKQQLYFRITRARYNILFMVFLTIINILFILFNSTVNIILPFSSAIAVYSIAFGRAALNEGNTTFYIVGLILAALIILFLLICYFKSKNKDFFTYLSFVLIVFDTIVLLAYSFISGDIKSLTVILDLLLHFLTLYYIYVAFKSHRRLAAINNNVINGEESNSSEIISAQNDYEDNREEDDDDDVEDGNENDDLTKPIRKYFDNNADLLVEGNINGLNAQVYFENSNALLVINGYVCDELYIDGMGDFTLRAIVNEVDFIFEYSRTFNGETMYLYANDDLLDSFGRR